MKKIVPLLLLPVLLVVGMAYLLKAENPKYETPMITLAAGSDITQNNTHSSKPYTGPDPADAFQEESTPDMNYELKRVATLYQKTTEYPDYSIPISSNKHLLDRNKNFPVERQYDRNGNQGAISVSLDKFRYEEGDVVSAEAVVQGSQGFKSGIRKVYAILDEQTIAFESVNMGDDERYYHASFSTSDLSGEMNFKFFVDMHNGDKLLQTVPFEVYSPIGEITGVGSTSIENNELVIPIKIKVDDSGFFRLSGNLIHKETNRPVTHLQGKKYLGSSGSNTIELKVYGKHFVDNGLEGDFLLKDLQLMQQPTVPGPDNKTKWGKEREEPLIIDDINKSDFSDTPYRDPLIVERLDFLNKIGNNP